MPRIAQIYIRQMRFDDARQKLLREIERHFFAGESEVEIVHGIGDYILRKMAEQELSKLDYVRMGDSYHTNPGSLRVTLLTPDPGLLDSYRG
ncbi:MAG TPA: Smr/MutS family protein [Turneriella sp.]|nr:Smr/MutS family protein [Turneriella sp.]HNJ66403.1 Smr/MutS family protein [Turneriella sp.]HNL11574.1 Smr/MutS family protein [Turneriella sp.]HNL53101.1 Smr/MutS family protein [Turneriella sp.]HNN01720.1 Smr/MutS family protein [Turneriella sp.]